MCKLPSAAGVTLDQIVKPGEGLLETAIRNKDATLVFACLAAFPAGKQIGPETIVWALKLLIQIGWKQRIKQEEKTALEDVAHFLVTSDPAQQISVQSAVSLIRAVLATKNKHHVDLWHKILKLPAVRQIDFDTNMQLQDYAEKMGLRGFALDISCVCPMHPAVVAMMMA